METRPNDRIELRVRLRRIQSNNEEDGEEVKPGGESSASPVVAVESISSSDCGGGNQNASSRGSWTSTEAASVRDDIVSVRFKLADAIDRRGDPMNPSKREVINWQRLNAMLFYEGYMAVRAKGPRSSAAELGEATSSRDGLPENRQAPDPADSKALNEEEDERVVGSAIRLSSFALPPAASVHVRDSESAFITSGDEGGRDGATNRAMATSTQSALTSNITDVHIDIYSAKALKLSLRGPVLSIVNDKNRSLALSKVISLPPFDPFMPQLQMQLIIKPIIPLSVLSVSANNVVEVEIKKNRIMQFIDDAAVKGNPQRAISPFLDLCNIYVRHERSVFYTFCCCKTCSDYREIVIHIMVEQFKAAHMVVMLLDVLMKAYGPMLSKNPTAYNKFEKLLESNKEVYWITCGFVYHKKAEHMDFIYDESLSDKMILVLFSSILMVNNPVLLLQILSFHVECVVKAYAEGFAEIVAPDRKKIPAREMLHYILNGYSELCRISEQVSVYLFAFENDFLRKFSLTWKSLCQRLYQQHVFAHLTDTMLACILTLKDDQTNGDVGPLIREYLDFDEEMNNIESGWTEVWLALNKFNLIETERQRRRSLLDVYSMFDTVVQDAIVFSLQEDNGEGDIYDFHSLENRRLAWQNIMAFTKMKWPDGFFSPPNTTVHDAKCKKCSKMLEYHSDCCKCITCSIAGSPLPPCHAMTGNCYSCVAQTLTESDVYHYETQLSTDGDGGCGRTCCDTDVLSDIVTFVKSDGTLSVGRRNATLQQLGKELLASIAEAIENNTDAPPTAPTVAADDEGVYHVAWALFKHLRDRKPYTKETIDEKYFCSECLMPACLVARSVLSNGMSLAISMHLVEHYQPVSLTRDELRSILPNIMFYNMKMVASDLGLEMTDVHDLVVKMYWTFVISVYATYFIKIDDHNSFNGTFFELNESGDICLRDNVVVGNELDTKFFDFLDKVKSLSPFQNEMQTSFAFTVDVQAEDFQKNLDKFFNLLEKHHSQLPAALKVQGLTPISVAATPIPVKAVTVVDTAPKKGSKEKMKKCKQGCFDHPELGDHCKESHINNKKRLKKECNHARMNETRDRLRKKLSKIVNARKATPGEADGGPSTSSAAAAPTARAVPTAVKPAAAATTVNPVAVATTVNPVAVAPTVKPVAVATTVKPVVAATAVNQVTATAVKPVAAATAVKPVAATAVNPVAATAVKPVAATAVKPVAAATAVNAVAATAVKPVAATAVNPVGPTAVKPVVATAVKPVAPTAVKPVAATAVKPVAATAVKPVAATAVKPVAATAVKPVAATAVKPVAATAVKPVAPTAMKSVTAGVGVSAVTQQPQSLKSAAAAAAVSITGRVRATATPSGENDSLECLTTLCDRISHPDKPPHTQGVGNEGNEVPQKAASSSLAPGASSAINPDPTRIGMPKVQNKDVKNLNNQKINNNKISSSTDSRITPIGLKNPTNSLPSASAKEPIAKAAAQPTVAATEPAKEIREPLDSSPVDQSKMKKWINEALSYIEGSGGSGGSGGGTGKKQPQTTNPKKAAKKAKQKQRKEEEKRVIELLDLRAQFHDLYFKEFMDKLQLRELKTGKKRDKRRIAELENNVKKLQRAKSNVEACILELIATVKHANADFRFSYLPTKEQQLEKIREVEGAHFHTITDDGVVAANADTASFVSIPIAYSQQVQPMPGYAPSLQDVDFRETYDSHSPRPHLLTTPMCYAPPQQQQLAPDVVAAMAANSSCGPTADPAKRIVTIRRVNLPNVPEPQVTVTAKGSSPDKDKLLYTFVNGQLLQTQPCEMAMSIPGLQITGGPEQLVEMHAMPRPKTPEPLLSKTQIKKERRRLEKIAAAQQQCAQPEKQQRQLYESAAIGTGKGKKKKKKGQEVSSDFGADTAVPVAMTQNAKNQQQQQHLGQPIAVGISPSASSVSISSTGATIRSTSNTPSGSLGGDTSMSSSVTPSSSRIQTRENSSSSQRTNAGVVVTAPQHPAKKNAKQQQNNKIKANSSTSIKKKQMPNESGKALQRAVSQPTSTVQIPAKLPAAAATTAAAPMKAKKQRSSASQEQDINKFDNNPFKTLNTPDSDSDLDQETRKRDASTLPVCPVMVTKSATEVELRASTKFAKGKTESQQHPLISTRGHRQSVADNGAGGDSRRKQKREQPAGGATSAAKMPPPATTRKVSGAKNTGNRANAVREQQQQFQSKQSTKRLVADPMGGRSTMQAKEQNQQSTKSRQTQGMSSAIGSSNKRGGGDRKSGHEHRPPLYSQAAAVGVGGGGQSRTGASNDAPPLSKRAQKQAQRMKKTAPPKQLPMPQQRQHLYHIEDDGRSMGMGMASHAKQPLLPHPQHLEFQSLTQQMQRMRVCGGGATQAPTIMPSYASVSNGTCHSYSGAVSNVSIMDQLNRGVQVENLSLPPGITLTKVDPAKSEQLRQKTESIRQLSQPLQPQPPPTMPAAYHHGGATIIAPSVGVASASYYATPPPYGMTAQQEHGGIIMVEANAAASSRTHVPPFQTRSAPLTAGLLATPIAAASTTKPSKSKKRRNKAKAAADAARSDHSGTGTDASVGSVGVQHPKMVTLRNPMFHGGPASAAAAATLLHHPPPQSQPSPGIVSGRTMGGLPLPAAPMMSMDQPAAIIKNENGMFTIRNPALHQAVTNGMAMGGYRQFGSNVNYYTPQEAAAEAARATKQTAASVAMAAAAAAARTCAATGESSAPSESFSYFSAVSPSTASTEQQSTPQHNNISISCTSIAADRAAGSAGEMHSDASIIARPNPPPKCISAIGSEVKSAQQQKLQQLQSKECDWRNFPPIPDMSGDSSCGFHAPGKYHQQQLHNQQQEQPAASSSYYNGFDVFGATVGGGGRSSNPGTLFDRGDCQMHHSCGDDSPPPTLTGFNSYLDGIAPSTGVIRYDDAAFLKNLIPGQNLNNEVSIHNISDSNFGRNASSPSNQPIHHHRVEITPVFANRTTPTSAYDRCPVGGVLQPQPHSLPHAHPSLLSQPPPPRKFFSNSVSNFSENFADYSTDSKHYATNNLINLHEMEVSELNRSRDARYNYGFEPVAEPHPKVIMDRNEMMVGQSPQSQRTSPYLNDSNIENFVQNLGALHISTDEHGRSESRGSGSGGGASVGNGAASGNRQLNSGGVDGGPTINNNSVGIGIPNINGWWHTSY